MRVLVDPEAFGYLRCGAARYFAAVLRGLRAAGVEVDLPLVGATQDYLRGWLPFDAYSPWPRMVARLRPRLVRRATILSRQLYDRRLKAGNFDVVLPTSVLHDTSFLNHMGDRPYLLVCHDTMRSASIPNGAIDVPSDPLHRLVYLARRAARIVCVSEQTRRDLLSSGPLPEERVAVVLTGNLLPLFAKRGAPLPSLPERYLLFVGSRHVRKNFDGTVRALAPLLQRPDGPSLVATGQLNVWERDFVDLLGLSDRVQGVEVDDARLVTLYQRALGLIYPSFYEGFGLPVLEAMALGCPVVASNSSSLPEIAGDAALLVDPADPAAILRAAERIADDPQLRTQLIAAGHARAARFSFDAMMDGFLDQLYAAAGIQRR
jgi:glycosyltransferase involved in cell wall biosynthesis